MRNLAILSGVVCALGLAGTGGADVLYWYGGTGGDWSDPTNWIEGGGTPAGRYPSTADDVGVLDGHGEQVTYDAAASGVVGGMQITGQYDNAYIIIARDALVDCTGDTGSALTPAGWIFQAPDDSSPTGYYINDGATLTVTGFKSATNNSNCWSQNYGPGTLKFAPDGDGKGYLYLGGARAGGFVNMTVDLSDLTVLECMNDGGTGPIAHNLTVSARGDCSNVADSKPIVLGRPDGATQTFAADASLAGTYVGRYLTTVASGLDGRYGPHLLVYAVGTDAAPNLIVFEKEAIAGLNFPKNVNQGGGGWIQPDPGTTGVARLVLEGNFLTDDHYAVDGLWDMTRIQLHLAGEKPTEDPDTGDPLGAETFQQLRWCAADLNTGGTVLLGDPGYFDGFDANYAVRRLLIGSDEGEAVNAAAFTTSAEGSAMYLYALEFLPGAYLHIDSAEDYVYYLSPLETLNGIPGAGLALPAGTQLGDFTNRPENIIMLGIPEPATLLLLAAGGLALVRSGRRRPSGSMCPLTEPPSRTSLRHSLRDAPAMAPTTPRGTW